MAKWFDLPLATLVITHLGRMLLFFVLMVFPFDLDLPIFLYTTATTLMRSVPKLRSSAPDRAIPLQIEYKEVLPAELTPGQSQYLAKWDAKLAAMNYQPACTYTAGLFSRNMTRIYASPVDKAQCHLLILELKTKGEQEVVVHHHVIIFTTNYSDGSKAITSGKSVKSFTDNPPYRIVQRCPHISGPAQLKRKHDQLTRDLGEPAWQPTTAKEIFEHAQLDHERFTQYQLQRGIYQLTADGKASIGTDKAHWRALRNHYNPFAGRPSWSAIAISILAGAGLPYLALMKLGPYLAKNAMDIGFAGALPLKELTAGFAFLMAGAIIGYFVDRVRVHWTFLATYIPAHLLMGWSFGIWPSCMIAALVAFYTGQIRQKRRLIMLQQ